MIKLSSSKKILSGEVSLESSKSISNRILLIKALSNQNFKIENLSSSDDTALMLKFIENYNKIKEIDCHHAGTTLRFLTAFLSVSKGNWILKGSERMHERPIGPLVECINKIGGNIKYIGKRNYPPLNVTGKNIEGGSVDIRGDISSQFISALLLIAPSLKKGLTINIKSKILSRPYIHMTLSLMEKMGIIYKWSNNVISIQSQSYVCNDFVVENDWSAASFWYSFVALSKSAEIKIPLLQKKSIQGDSKVADIFKSLGVSTQYLKDKIIIKKNNLLENNVKIDLSDYPDLSLPIITTCAGLGIDAFIYGLESLKHKESDRLSMIKNELAKFNIVINIDSSSAKINGNQIIKNPDEIIKTHNDHRIPMSIAPLCMKTNYIKFDNKTVVNKSYPKFWNDLEIMGMQCKEY
tara:strand:- start:3656 stop:4882 length:1227 start_codon:yes stop_codon:yes gene_type:complete